MATISKFSESDDDDRVAELLNEAWPNPPVPKSLRRRIETHLQESWGTLVNSAPSDGRSTARRGAKRWLSSRTWSMVAVMLLVCLAIVPFRGVNGYSWAAMIEMLREQSFIQAAQEGEAGQSLWLSLNDQLLVRQTPTETRVIDFHNKIVLDYQAGSREVVQTSLPPSAASPSPAGLMWMFLNEQVDPAAAAPDVTVAEETLVHPSEGDGASFELHARLQRQDVPSPPLEMIARINTQTRLPVEFRVASASGAVVRRLSVNRAASGQAGVQLFGIPADVPIVSAPNVSAPTTLSIFQTPPQANPETQPIKTALNEVNQVVITAESVTPSEPSVPQLADASRPRGAVTLGWQPVPPLSISSAEASRRIDTILENVWRSRDVQATSPAADEELMRRCYLDLVGRIPTVSEVRSFLSDDPAGRYERLVDRLLASHDSASYLAAVWRGFLLPEGVDLSRFGGTAAFEEWLRAQFYNNVPYDEIVRRLLLAEGRVAESGPLLFYSAAKLNPDALAARTARVFLGMKLECAQCHDDPFEPWTQQDFWSFAALFAQISRPKGELESVSSVMRVQDIDRGDVMLPNSQLVVPPRLLDGDDVDTSPGALARRRQLAQWLTSRDNPYFARATVNRVWAQLFGRGIVEPVDGFGTVHQPNVPELLDTLAGFFVDSGFDLRQLLHTIALTNVYRLSSADDPDQPQRREWFAQMSVKPFTAEQLYDSIAVATLLDPRSVPDPAPLGISRVGNLSRQQFLEIFRTPAGKATEFQSGIPQALMLMNGALTQQATDLTRGGLLRSLEAPFFSNDQRVRVLFLATLSREPTTEEWTYCHNLLQERQTDSALREALSDVLWALLNSAEFAMNH